MSIQITHSKKRNQIVKENSWYPNVLISSHVHCGIFNIFPKTLWFDLRQRRFSFILFVIPKICLPVTEALTGPLETGVCEIVIKIMYKSLVYYNWMWFSKDFCLKCRINKYIYRLSSSVKTIMPSNLFLQCVILEFLYFLVYTLTKEIYWGFKNLLGNLLGIYRDW